MSPYVFMKLIHILAAVVFLGNILTGAFWMRQAHKTRNIPIINHTIKSILRSDKIFTMPGVMVILITGLGAAIHNHIHILKTGWIFWSLVLFALSGILFMWKLTPIQKEIYSFTSIKTGDEPMFDWGTYQKLLRKWNIWGFLSLLTPLIALIMMVLKLPAGSIF